MRYKVSTIEDLRQLAEELGSAYQGTNLQRHSFIQLLNKLTEMTKDSSAEMAQNVLLGAALFQLEVIRSEYRYSWPERSTFYSLLLKKLNINKDNCPGDDERLIYLFKFYHYVVTFFSERTIDELKAKHENFCFTNKDSLIRRIRENLKTVKKRDTVRVDKLIHAIPELEALQRNTQTLSGEYIKLARAQSGRWFANHAERDRLVKFIDFMHHSCDYCYLSDYRKIPEMYDLERNIRRGLILFVLMSINNTYRFLSPKGGWFTSGSQLFKDSLQVMNVEDLKDIEPAEKADLLKSLQTHLIKASKLVNDEPFITYLRAHSTDVLTTDQELYKNDIANFLVAQEKMKHEPRGRLAAISTAAGCAAHSTTDYAIRQGAGSYVASGAMGAIAASVGGVMGVAVYVSGKLILSGLGALLGDGVISAATASIYGWLLDKVGTSVGSVTAGIFSYPYNVSNEGILELRKQLSSEDEKLFCEWVNTLLKMPIEIVPEKDKENIRRVFGLEQHTELLPLNQDASSLGNRPVIKILN